MKMRKLGTTGLTISEVAFGGVEIGIPYGIGVENEADMPTESQAIELLHAAVDKGVNFFDTARMYGTSENVMGKAFVGLRPQLVLASKCRHFRGKDGALPADADLKTFVEKSLAESLAALKTDYLDVFMLHQADLGILKHPLIAEIFTDLKKQGIVRATGASVYTLEETNLAIESGAWDVIQLPFNLMNQSQGIYFEKASQKGVGIVVRSVLMKGLLSDRGKNMHPALAAVEQHIAGYQDFLNEHYPDLPTLATKFALSFDGVSSVLVGIDKMEYLDTAVAIAQRPDIDATTRQKLAQMAYPDPDFLNLHHWDKMGWLK